MNQQITIKEIASQYDRSPQAMHSWINKRPDFPKPQGISQDEKGRNSRTYSLDAVNQYFENNPLCVRKKQAKNKKTRYIPSQQATKPDINNLITQFLARPYGEKRESGTAQR